MKLVLCLVALWTILVPSFSFESFTMTSGYLNSPYIGFRHVINSVGSPQPDLVRDLGTYRVTTPGTYFFTFTALSDPKGFRISLRRNRVPLVTGYSDAGGYKTVTLNVLCRVSRGDVIYPYVEDGLIYESPMTTQRAYTSFSGFLVQGEGSFFGGLMGRSTNGTHDDLEHNEEDNSLNVMHIDDQDDIFQRLSKH